MVKFKSEARSTTPWRICRPEAEAHATGSLWYRPLGPSRATLAQGQLSTRSQQRPCCRRSTPARSARRPGRTRPWLAERRPPGAGPHSPATAAQSRRSRAVFRGPGWRTWSARPGAR
ncbi:major facilitator family transporter [Trichinella spiralis]|uniref:major facilitator family transporter n=1 Tax=Trichinella spiralis TaxID=6334 RepID=UPI0001EFE301|nr:major facilitator family transporter [Trichinella spiralis]